MTMSDVEESRLLFQFAEGVQFLKLDETPFFTNRFSVLQGSKGVDFIAVQDNALYFIEVKNFSQHEIENKKRLIITSDDNVALEVSYKVRDSIACLVGAFKNDNDILKPFYTKLRSPNVTVRVILFLEGQIENQPAVFIQHKGEPVSYGFALIFWCYSTQALTLSSLAATQSLAACSGDLPSMISTITSAISSGVQLNLSSIA